MNSLFSSSLQLRLFTFGKTVLRAVKKEKSIIAFAGMEMEYIALGLTFFGFVFDD